MLTAAQSVRASEYPTLLDLTVWGEHQSDVILIALLGDHSNEQLPVFNCCIKHNKSNKRPVLVGLIMGI